MSALMPATLGEALAVLADDPAMIPIAGGTDLLVQWPTRVNEHDHTYLDLSGLAELRPLRWTDEALILGALTTFWDVVTEPRVAAELPLLVAAARQVGAIQIQARGTWAGNIVNASPAADGVLALMAYDAVVVLASRRGVVEVPLHEFYTGYKTMRRAPDELVTAIRVPRIGHTGAFFEKIGTRRAQGIAKVGLAVTRRPDGWRVVAASVAPTVRRCSAVERFLNDGARARGPEDLLPPIDQDVAPIDDMRSTATYRRQVLARVLYHGLLGERPAAR